MLHDELLGRPLGGPQQRHRAEERLWIVVYSV